MMMKTIFDQFVHYDPYVWPNSSISMRFKRVQTIWFTAADKWPHKAQSKTLFGEHFDIRISWNSCIPFLNFNETMTQ